MPQSSGAMTWSEGVAALLTFGIIIFLLWVSAAVLGTVSRSIVPAHELKHVEITQVTQDQKSRQ
jgi:hypothetical protein